MVGLGCSTCNSGATVGHGISSGSSCATVRLGSSTCDSGIDVGLGCGSGVQEGLHTLTMVAV